MKHTDGPDSEIPVRTAEPRLPGLPYGLTLWLFTVATWLAWAPFRLRTGALNFEFTPNLSSETLSHLGLVAPLAVVFSASVIQVGRRRPAHAALAVVTAATILESGQAALEVRSVSPYDLAAGCIGGFLAIALTRRVLRAGASARGIVCGLALGVFLTLALAVNLNTRGQNAGLRIADWDPHFQVLQGDEWGGLRPYDGEVSEGRICAGEKQDRFCIVPGESEKNRQVLIERAERTQVVEVSAWVRSNSGQQSGPARIITFSEGLFDRNVTLAQSGTDLVLRLRSPRGGPNGAWNQFSLRGAVPIGRSVFVTGTFRRGIVHLECSDAPISREGSFGAPYHGTLFVNGRNRLKASFVFHGRSLFVGALVFFGGAGLVLGLVWMGRFRSLIPAAIVFGFALPGLLSWAVWDAPYPGPREQFITVFVIVAGALAGWWDRVRFGRFESTRSS